MGFYAIGFGDWVEVREALKPPKAYTTEVDRGFMEEKVPVTRGEYYIDAVGRERWREPKYEKKQTPVTIKITAYEGGRVKRTIRFNELYRLIKLAVKKNEMVKLTVTQAKQAIEWKRG